jgi:hypothetical protein
MIEIPTKMAAIDVLNDLVGSNPPYRNDISITKSELVILVERLLEFKDQRPIEWGGPEERKMATESRTRYRRDMIAYFLEKTEIEVPLVPGLPTRFYNDLRKYFTTSD